MKRPQLYIFAAVGVMGLSGMLLRLQQFAAVEPEGLLPAGHPAATWSIILTCVAALALLICCFLGKNRDHRIYTTVPVDAFCSLLAGAAVISLYLSGGFSAIALPATIGSCMGFFGLCIYQIQRKKAPLLLHCVLCVGMMLMCYGQYGNWSFKTQISAYVFQALSSAAAIMLSLQLCLLHSGHRNFKQVYFYAGAVFFSSLMSMAAGNVLFFAGLALWAISTLFHTPYAMILPAGLMDVVSVLEQQGYEVWMVGGCVRDSLLGLVPADVDLCTNATPEQMADAFAGYELVRHGEKHGTIGVVFRGGVLEFTTYRSEGSYADSRHPDWVEFVSDVKQDLARRDFTVNAIAYHPKRGYLDLYDGQRDLHSGLLKTVGDPEKRFKEDALRILRGIRFGMRFDLQVDPATEKAMTEFASTTQALAVERVYQELSAILLQANLDSLLRFAPVLTQVVPEMKDTYGFDQRTHYHRYDVYTHTAHVVDNVPQELTLRWAAFLHDIGKPESFTMDEKGQGHFKGHAKSSTRIAGEVLARLKAPTELTQQVLFLIEHHMDELICEKNALKRKLSHHGEELMKMLVTLQKADFYGKGTHKEQQDPGFDKMLKLIDEILAEKPCLTVRDLAIDGHDLMELGFTPGPQLGHCQKYLLEQVLDGQVINAKDDLLALARQFMNEQGGSL